MLTVLTLLSLANAAEIPELLADSHRAPEHVARDAARHPAETLGFFGVKPEMTVIEISPSAGYYTEILAPYLADSGKYIAAWQGLDTTGGRKYSAKTLTKLGEDKRYEKVEITTFSARDMGMVPADTADMVLTFRNVHNWTNWGEGQAEAAFQAFYTALKPGGALGVVEHRAPAGTTPDPKSGYLTEATVTALAEKAGFVLERSSEINANPKDTHDHPEGVWTLPPSLRLGDTDRKKYVAIGESDRMTLLFRKPADAPLAAPPAVEAPPAPPAPEAAPAKGKKKGKK